MKYLLCLGRRGNSEFVAEQAAERLILIFHGGTIAQGGVCAHDTAMDVFTVRVGVQNLLRQLK